MTFQEFRARFPICASRVYVNSCSQGALSEDVRHAMSAYLDSWQTLGSPWEQWVGDVEALRAEFAGLIGADAGEVAVLPNASVAVGGVASALAYEGPRRTVVLGDFEFPTMGHVWMAQERRGARVSWVRADGHVLPVERYAAAVNEETLIVPVAHVCFRNGYRADIAALARLCRERGALSLVDDYQHTGTAPIDVRALGIDMLVSGSLKYLVGPPGVAFLYVRRGLIGRFEPTVTGWFGRAEPFAFKPDVLDWASDAHRFEHGTPGVPSVAGALAGLRLLKSLAPAEVGARIAGLSARFLAAARDEGWLALTPDDPAGRGPLCVLASSSANELARRLSGRGIIGSARGNGLRVSFHAYNNEEDVDAVLDALRDERALLEKQHAS